MMGRHSWVFGLGSPRRLLLRALNFPQFRVTGGVAFSQRPPLKTSLPAFIGPQDTTQQASAFSTCSRGPQERPPGGHPRVPREATHEAGTSSRENFSRPSLDPRTPPRSHPPKTQHANAYWVCDLSTRDWYKIHGPRRNIKTLLVNLCVVYRVFTKHI